MKTANQIPGMTIGKFKIYAPKVIESLLNFPVGGYADYVSETYSCINLSDDKNFVDNAQSKRYKYYFVFNSTLTD